MKSFHTFEVSLVLIFLNMQSERETFCYIPHNAAPNLHSLLAMLQNKQSITSHKLTGKRVRSDEKNRNRKSVQSITSKHPRGGGSQGGSVPLPAAEDF